MLAAIFLPAHSIKYYYFLKDTFHQFCVNYFGDLVDDREVGCIDTAQLIFMGELFLV